MKSGGVGGEQKPWEELEMKSPAVPREQEEEVSRLRLLTLMSVTATPGTLSKDPGPLVPAATQKCRAVA